MQSYKLSREGSIPMSAKKREKRPEITYLIVSILVILVLLFILWRLYYLQWEQPQPAERSIERAPAGQAEAMAELERLRQRRDFSWPEVLDKDELQLLEYSAFSLAYHEAHEQAAWVAYLLTRKHALNKHERRNNFRTDQNLPTGSASPADYTNSGYDRGHLAPAADFDFNRKALSESFYMTNISPQLPAFNRGAWKELEDQVRKWATEYDSLYVITGPVLEKGLKKIGDNRVSVPKYFYKIIFDSREPEIKMIGFLMPNKKITQGPWPYVVPIDSIEKVSGLNFFPQIPDILEDSLESMIQSPYWTSPQP